MRHAAERFASQDKTIEQFTTEQLKGALRGIVTTLSVVELMRERKKFSDQIAADRAINQKNIASQEANLIDQTALDTNTANADTDIGHARAEAEQLAHAQAEQAVLQLQAENKQAQLDADVKRVANAQRDPRPSRAVYTRESRRGRCDRAGQAS